MRQPYVYTMPEEFVHDQSVPARWRVYALIKGFFINNSPFYGSNKWIMEKLTVSEQTVSNAFAELEELNLITIKRTRRTRVVTDKLKTDETLTNLGLRPKPTPISDPNQFGTNSVSNSVSKKASETLASSQPIIEVREDEKKPKAKRNTEVIKLRDKMYDIFQNKKGVRPTNHFGDYSTIQFALTRLTPEQVEYMVEYQLDYENPVTVRECLTARKIDKYLQDNY